LTPSTGPLLEFSYLRLVEVQYVAVGGAPLHGQLGHLVEVVVALRDVLHLDCGTPEVGYGGLLVNLLVVVRLGEDDVLASFEVLPI